MRADWRWLRDEAPGAATPSDPQVWETGTGGERLAHLTRLRGTDPAAALALLESTWQTETPEDRTRFVDAIGTGLSLADDAFLDRALDDRRKGVREAALDLLRRLPGSSLGRLDDHPGDGGGAPRAPHTRARPARRRPAR
nr:hypothetical protein GCM10020092_026420 [Actinoplanes digitatis]